MSEPLLSIIIPSKNRAVYAISSVKSILSIQDETLEVLVHDNSDNNDLGKSLAAYISDSRLRYIYDPSPMPILWNFEKAMEQSKGKYVCFLGDDDSVNPEIMDAVHWADKNGLDAISGNLSAGYHWPKGSQKGHLTQFPISGKWKFVNLEEELKSYVKAGCVYYLNHHLPKAYHGLVKRTCLEKIRSITGEFFGGLTPDSNSAVSLAIVSEKVVSIDYPLTLPGSSTASDQTHRTEEAKKRPLKDAPQLQGRQDYAWSSIVPRIFSGETMWAESGVAALTTMGRDDLVKEINVAKMMALMVKASPHYLDEITNHYISLSSGALNKQQVINDIEKEIRRIEKKDLEGRVLNRLKKTLGNRRTYRYQHINDLEQAVAQLSACLRKHYKPLKFYLERH